MSEDDPSQWLNYTLVVIFGLLIIGALLFPVGSVFSQSLYLEEGQTEVSEEPTPTVKYSDLTSRQQAQFAAAHDRLQNPTIDRVELTGENAAWSKNMGGILYEGKYYPIVTGY
jgi:hypothetical protein